MNLIYPIRLGDICKCRKGIIGIITSLPGNKDVCYGGVTLDGKSWKSVSPILVAKSVNEYFKLER